jgi:hypothetical protein
MFYGDKFQYPSSIVNHITKGNTNCEDCKLSTLTETSYIVLNKLKEASDWYIIVFSEEKVARWGTRLRCDWKHRKVNIVSSPFRPENGYLKYP